MTLQEKILFGAAVVVVAIIAMFAVLKLTSSSQSFGAAGGLLAEHYLPFVAINGGYNSALPITTTGSLTAACFQSYATSTATAMKLQFTASTTAPTNGSGIIPVISYGTCP